VWSYNAREFWSSSTCYCSSDPVNVDDVQVLSVRFPSLSKHVAKLVEIFCALCPGVLTAGDGSDDDREDDSASSNYLHHIGRPMSTRLIYSCFRP